MVVPKEKKKMYFFSGKDRTFPIVYYSKSCNSDIKGLYLGP